jgi:hypothetical protein
MNFAALPYMNYTVIQHAKLYQKMYAVLTRDMNFAALLRYSEINYAVSTRELRSVNTQYILPGVMIIFKNNELRGVNT